jgi:hypothetical protein
LNGSAPSPYENYLKRIEHKMNTRNNRKNIILPKVKTESGRRSFMFQGGKLWNRLPVDQKEEFSIVRFKSKVRNIFNE